MNQLIFSIAILTFYELDSNCISISVSCDKSVYIDLSRKYDFGFVKNKSIVSLFLGSIYVLSYTHAHVTFNVHPHIYTKIYVNIDRLLIRRSQPNVVQLCLLM